MALRPGPQAHQLVTLSDRAELLAGFEEDLDAVVEGLAMVGIGAEMVEGGRVEFWEKRSGMGVE